MTALGQKGHLRGNSAPAHFAQASLAGNASPSVPDRRGLLMDTLSPALAETGAGLWVTLLLTAYRWQDVILFCVPGEPLILASEV